MWRATALAVAVAVVLASSCRSESRSGPATAPLPALRPVSVAELREAIAAPGASAVLVNVWATWCLPCRKEFPDLLRAAAALRGRGLRLVLVSADFEDNAEAARTFLARAGVDFPSYLKVGPDMEFIEALSPRWTGALPASFLFDGSGSLRDFWEGEADYETFVARSSAVLDAASVMSDGGER